MNRSVGHPIHILLIEDNAADVRLTREALKDAQVATALHVVPDGVEALAYLRHEGAYAAEPRPHVILLDLNLPRMDGRELLAHVKADPGLRRIPVVILTTSQAEQDILRTYDLHANCYITKPVDLDQFLGVMRLVEAFWLNLVQLPNGTDT